MAKNVFEKRFLNLYLDGEPLQENSFGGGLKSSEEDGKSQFVAGYATVFDKRAKVDWFFEVVRKGAFKKSLLPGNEVKMCFNHDVNFLLASRESKTLSLWEDDYGLAFKADVGPKGESPLVDHVVSRISKGILKHCSFMFTIRSGNEEDQRWSESILPDGSFEYTREILNVNLMEVGPVVFPCYDGTDVHQLKSLFPDSSNKKTFDNVRSTRRSPDHIRRESFLRSIRIEHVG